MEKITSFNEAEAIKPRNPAANTRLGRYRSPVFERFNEAEAIKPRNQLHDLDAGVPVPRASMRPRQSSLGIKEWAVTTVGWKESFNEAEAIKPRNPVAELILNATASRASMRPRQSSLGIRLHLSVETSYLYRCFNEAEAIKPRNPVSAGSPSPGFAPLQ